MARTGRRVRALTIVVLALIASRCGEGDALRQAGESCASDAECLPQLLCAGDTLRCAPPAQEGAPCTRGEECTSGLLCMGNPLRCALPGQACSVCTVNADCAPGYVCAPFSDGSRRCGTGTGGTSCLIP
jgi:hypothetical protein